METRLVSRWSDAHALKQAPQAHRWTRRAPVSAGFLSRLLVVGLLLLGTGLEPAPVWAQAVSPDAGVTGEIVQSHPKRQGGRVSVDYAVRLLTGSLQPGMVLAAQRPTNYGRTSGPPMATSGWMVVTAQGEGLYMTRPIPAGGEHPNLTPNVPIVGDQVAVERSLNGIAPAGAGIELTKLFPQGNTTLAAEATALMPELMKAVGKPDQALVVVYYPTEATPENRSLAYEQVQVVARKTRELLALDESKVFAVIMPLPGEGDTAGRLAARAEVRPIPKAKSGDTK